MATFYLKYRPQTIDELDLDSVRLQLTRVLRAKNIPHAFLFSGSRGLGKTSAARILAKALNCEKRKGIEPCNACEACVSITKGNAIDVIEIDGASNRGIDDVRALRESVASLPLRLTKKVYVIDEVHMLTREAFNALLKTLEEPPEHVVFILATTEPHKLPETIISRAFHVQFQRASEAEVKRSLKRVIKGEKLTVDEVVLDKIIAKADGGFRDSTKMLEQLAFVNKTIDETVFSTVFPQADITPFLTFLSEKDGKSALEWIANQQQHGVDWEEVLRNLLFTLKELLLQGFGIGTSKNTLFSIEEIKKLITLCMQAGAQLKSSFIPTLPLELVVAHWCYPDNSTTEIFVSQEKQKTKEATNPSEKKTKVSLEKKLLTDKKSKTAKENNEKNEIPADSKAVPLSITFDELTANWEKFLTTIRPYNHSVEALLRSAQPHNLINDTIIIKVYYQFHKGRLETDKCLSIVEKAFEEQFGARPKIQYILGEKQEKVQLEKAKDEELEKSVEEIFS